MTVLEDLIKINKGVGEKSLKSFRKNWMIVFAGLAYVIINIIAYSIIGLIFRGPLRIISGFISAFITASMISNYLYLLYNVVYFDHISLEKFKYGFQAFLRPVYSVLVLGWIANYFLGVFGFISPIGAMSISRLAGLVVFIVFNALPETLYQKNYGGMDTLAYSMDFFKDNILNWGLPNLIFYLIIYLVTGKVFMEVLPTQMLGVSYIGGFTIIRLVLGQVIFSFMMIYRGYLYKILSTSTRRKREFMNKL